MKDLNNLYKAYKASKANSDWKTDVQKYEMSWLSELTDIQHQLESRTYYTQKGTEFTISERGKARRIVGNKMRDRVVRHAFCDYVLNPIVFKYLIYDNGASQVGKGITFSRSRLLKHLRNYYSHYGNEGYILLIDFSKYYDNILHDKVREMLYGHLDDEAKWMLDIILNDFLVDVSYMTTEEYTNCLSIKYDSLNSPICCIGKKYMKKSVNIGDQTSQTIGIYYPTRIDNYVKIVRGQRYYGRYMDDSYIISKDKDELKSILSGVKDVAKSLGIFINERKTHIYKLSHGFRYLQNWYQITDSGRVIVKINTKRLVAMRRKLKKLSRRVINGECPFENFEQLYRSWIQNYYRIMSRKQRDNLNALYDNLVKEINNGLQNCISRQNRN